MRIVYTFLQFWAVLVTDETKAKEISRIRDIRQVSFTNALTTWWLIGKISNSMCYFFPSLKIINIRTPYFDIFWSYELRIFFPERNKKDPKTNRKWRNRFFFLMLYQCWISISILVSKFFETFMHQLNGNQDVSTHTYIQYTIPTPGCWLWYWVQFCFYFILTRKIAIASSSLLAMSARHFILFFCLFFRFVTCNILFLYSLQF